LNNREITRRADSVVSFWFKDEATYEKVRNCFSFLSYSFSNLTIEELGNWIKQLEKMKHPDFILYFAMWLFRNKALHEKEYFREVHQKPAMISEKYSWVTEISNKINAKFATKRNLAQVRFSRYTWS